MGRQNKGAMGCHTMPFPLLHTQAGTCEDSHLFTSYHALVHVLVCNQRALHRSGDAMHVLVCNQRALHRSGDAMHVLVCNQLFLHTSYRALVHVLVCNHRALHRAWIDLQNASAFTMEFTPVCSFGYTHHV